jgi:1-deoxy-D-xylulose-5-phosphate reductoisomerase
MRSIVLLGSTGSIGRQCLDLVREQSGAFRVEGLSAGRGGPALAEQVREFRPRLVAVRDDAGAEAVRAVLPSGATLFVGPDANLELIAAAHFDLAVHGMVGAAGVLPTRAVLERGKTLALANKESMVVAGELLVDLARRRGAAIVPVDSEHSALFQCLGDATVDSVRRLVLTASGGPLWERPADRMAHVTRAEALAHPNWDMGPRITIGSATLLNKALEVIEAHHLFGVPKERIAVVVHRQSIVHSLVEFVDGSVLAQMGPPDMRGPLHFALHWPRRAPSTLAGFDLARFARLTFEEPDTTRFPALALGWRALELGGDAPCALNAADEIAVEAFLDERIPFTRIAELDGEVVSAFGRSANDVETLLERDAEARELARCMLAGATAHLKTAQRQHEH